MIRQFEKDPESFAAEAAEETEKLRAKLLRARELVKTVTLSRDLTLKISEVCSLINIDGLRGDIVVNRAAKALAALEGRSEATMVRSRASSAPATTPVPCDVMIVLCFGPPPVSLVVGC